jgi:hypothetical protein
MHITVGLHVFETLFLIRAHFSFFEKYMKCEFSRNVTETVTWSSVALRAMRMWEEKTYVLSQSASALRRELCTYIFKWRIQIFTWKLLNFTVVLEFFCDNEYRVLKAYTCLRNTEVQDNAILYRRSKTKNTRWICNFHTWTEFISWLVHLQFPCAATFLLFLTER